MWRSVGIAFTALGLASCAMVESTLIEDGLSGRCASEAGYYYLPKTHIQVEVKKVKPAAADQNKGPDAEWHEIAVKRVRVADRTRGYCLDYLRRASSEDDISIKKYKAQPFLGLVSSDSTDRSLEIAETLVKTVFTAVSGNPDYSLKSSTRNFGSAAGVTHLLKLEYDPFDPERSAVVNHTLRDFGFCLVLEQYTFDLNASSIDRYCESPRRVWQHHGHHRFDYAPVASAPSQQRSLLHLARDDADPTAAVRGLYYRPRIPYVLYVFVKKNLQATRGWTLASMKPVAMENIAPILSIGVDRTAFAQRKTTLVFDEGMLKDACHFKGSELVELAKLPVYVTQSVVALPANIIQVRIDQTQGLAELIKAQDEAIKTQTKYLVTLNKLTDQASLAAGTPTGVKTVAKGFPTAAGSTGLDTTQKLDDDKIALVDGSWAACKTAVSTPSTALGATSLTPGTIQVAQ